MSQQIEGTRYESDIFQLPENWQEGRARVQGIAIGSLENAIWMEQSGGVAKLQLSVPDVGLLANSSIADARALRAEAQNNAGSTPRKMLAARVRKSLRLDTEDRPVVTAEVPLTGLDKGIAKLSRGALKARNLSYESADKIMTWRGDPRAVVLDGLMHYIKSDQNVAGNFSGELTQESPSKLIMEACRRIVNGSVALYMERNGIPGLYHDEYGELAIGHAINDDPKYPYFTAPFQKYVSFVNASNAAAFLDGTEVPYPLDRLAEAVDFIERYRRNSTELPIEEHDKGVKTVEPQVESRNPPSDSAVSVESHFPTTLSKSEIKVLENGFGYLKKLHRETAILLECDAFKGGEDDVLVRLKITVGDNVYESEAQGECSKHIFNEAAASLILSYDLISNPPSKGEYPKVDFEEQLYQKYNPDFFFKQEADGVVACTVICKKPRGIPLQVTRLSTSEEGAKASASLAMLRMLSLEIPGPKRTAR